MSKLLFPGVDPKERRSQLRIVLGHLRKKLNDLGITGVYSESGTDLQLDDAVSLDAYELVVGDTVTQPRLAEYAQPVLVGCQSRFADRCRVMVKNVVEASLPAVLSQCRTDEELWAITPILSQLNALYPLSATICASHVAVLKRVHLYEEATQEITEFEMDWLESYGAQDRPNIDTLIHHLTLSTHESIRAGVN